MPRNILQHVDCEASSACMVCIDIVDSCWLLRYIDLFLSISSTNPSQPPAPQKKSHTCVNFSKRCLDNKALPGTCETAPSPRCMCTKLAGFNWKSHQNLRILWFFQRTWYYDTPNNPTASLHRWWCRYWRHIFQCLSKSKTDREEQPVAQRSPKPWYTNMSLMFQADVPWMYPYYLANLDDPCVHVAGFTPQTATFHSSLQLGKHSSETSQEPLCHAILRIQPPHASKPLPKVQSTSESM